MEATKVVYCGYCKRLTTHKVIHREYNREDTGGRLLCEVCSSARIHTIQGFDAALM